MAGALTSALFGGGGSGLSAPPATVDDARSPRAKRPLRIMMSGKQKTIIK
ncbi:hypothetical protein ABK905_17155 [Acerihabitans sp. KWT182]|uniref:Uncharacterized protein n=1 Tax=Acerihabitans sp. KWT182 TaxID=3157919 RepID=A0AAU7Q5R7_9GAMM